MALIARSSRYGGVWRIGLSVTDAGAFRPPHSLEGDNCGE